MAACHYTAYIFFFLLLDKRRKEEIALSSFLASGPQFPKVDRQYGWRDYVRLTDVAVDGRCKSSRSLRDDDETKRRKVTLRIVMFLLRFRVIQYRHGFLQYVQRKRCLLPFSRGLRFRMRNNWSAPLRQSNLNQWHLTYKPPQRSLERKTRTTTFRQSRNALVMQYRSVFHEFARRQFFFILKGVFDIVNHCAFFSLIEVFSSYLLISFPVFFFYCSAFCVIHLKSLFW